MDVAVGTAGSGDGHDNAGRTSSEVEQALVEQCVERREVAGLVALLEDSAAGGLVADTDVHLGTADIITGGQILVDGGVKDARHDDRPIEDVTSKPNAIETLNLLTAFTLEIRYSLNECYQEH